MIYLNLDFWVLCFVFLCYVTKWEVMDNVLLLQIEVWWLSKKESALLWVQTFNKLQLFRTWVFGGRHFLRINKVILSLQRTQWWILLLIIEFKLSSKCRFLKMCICHQELHSFPVLKIFSDKVSGDIMNAIFDMVSLYHYIICMHLRIMCTDYVICVKIYKTCTTHELVFSKWPMCDVKHAGVKALFKVPRGDRILMKQHMEDSFICFHSPYCS